MRGWIRGLLLVALMGLLGSCIGSPARYARPYDPKPYAPTDWRCEITQDGHTYTMWTNDRGIHDIIGVVTNPNIRCSWVDPG